MALRNILVHVDNSETSAVRLQTAAELAQAHQARLTGLYILPPQGQNDTTAVIEAQERAARTRAAEAETAFNTVTVKSGIAAEWCSARDTPDHGLELPGHDLDLVIIGRIDEEDREPATIKALDRLAQEHRLPLLVIPKSGVSQPIDQRILVAWDGSHGAVRVIDDALPLLERARHVDVLAAEPATKSSEQKHMDISSHLQNHGIKSEIDYVPAKDMEATDTLLSRAADKDINLVVISVHGDRRERVLSEGTPRAPAHVAILLCH